ncbi:hypothetical protein A4A49_35494, partial [Nicotiana attenuata]
MAKLLNPSDNKLTPLIPTLFTFKPPFPSFSLCLKIRWFLSHFFILCCSNRVWFDCLSCGCFYCSTFVV